LLDIIEKSNHKQVIFGPKPITNWPVEELQYFFDNTITEMFPLRLDQCTMITDLSLFIQSNMDIIRTNNGIQTFEPYYFRLLRLKEILTQLNSL
jgi:hypothetical protein